jgi:hypothetical protein
MLVSMRRSSLFALLFVAACSGSNPLVVQVIELSPDGASASGSPDAGGSPSLDATMGSGTDAGPSDPVAPPDASVDAMDFEKDATGSPETGPQDADVEKDATGLQESGTQEMDADRVETSTPPDASIGVVGDSSAPVMCGGVMCSPATCIPIYQRLCCTTANACGCISAIGGGTCN